MNVTILDVSSVIVHFRNRFARRILRTTQEKWIDGTAIVLTALYLWFIGKPITFWETAEPFVWLVCLIIAIHLLLTTRQVWKELSEPPAVREIESPILLPDASTRITVVTETRPAYFRTKLSGILLILLIVLCVAAYGIRLVAAASLRTYIYLVPTAELVNCEKRAFFLKITGPQVLYNVEISLRDDKSGKMKSQTYSEVDPHPRLSDKYLWFKPSSPWDEDYTVTVASRDSRSSQQLLLRSIQNHARFAMQITLNENKKQVLRCRDTELRTSYRLAAGEHRTCDDLMRLPGDVLSDLDVDNYLCLEPMKNYSRWLFSPCGFSSVCPLLHSSGCE